MPAITVERKQPVRQASSMVGQAVTALQSTVGGLVVSQQDVEVTDAEEVLEAAGDAEDGRALGGSTPLEWTR